MSTARRYPTRNGDRLNVHAVCEKLGIGESTFRTRQSEGWHQLEGGKLVPKMMRWEGGVEQTFLESDIDEILRIEQSFDGSYDCPDGLRHNAERFIRELDIDDTTRWLWEKSCPGLNGAPLIGRWMNSPVTGRRQRTYKEADAETIKRSRAAPQNGTRETPQGFAISTERALEELGISKKETLNAWWKKGTVDLDGKRLTKIVEAPCPVGRSSIWWLQSEIDQIKKSRIEKAKSRYQSPRGPCLPLLAVIKRFGWGWKTLKGWKTNCPFHSSGKLIPEMQPSKRELQVIIHTWVITDLEEIERNIAKSFNGIYHTKAGERLNFRAAKERYNLGMKRIQEFMKKCRHLPTGRLESVKLHPPIKGSKKEHTFLDADLATIVNAERAELAASERTRQHLKTAMEILDIKKITQASDQIRALAVIRDLRERGILQPYQTLRVSAGKRQLRVAYDIRVFNQIDWESISLTSDTREGKRTGLVETSGAHQAPARAHGRPDQNADLVNYAFRLLDENENLRNKDILQKCRAEFPDHPIFKAKSPQQALRSAMYHTRKKAEK